MGDAVTSFAIPVEQKIGLWCDTAILLSEAGQVVRQGFCIR